MGGLAWEEVDYMPEKTDSDLEVAGSEISSEDQEALQERVDRFLDPDSVAEMWG